MTVYAVVTLLATGWPIATAQLSCPGSGMYVGISACNSWNMHECPANAVCWNEVCCALSNTAGISAYGYGGAGSGYSGGWIPGGYYGYQGTGMRCPSGTYSVTPCVYSVCNIPGQTCYAGYCCPMTGYGIGGGVGVGGGVGIGAGYITCPNGRISTTPCIGNACSIPGETCYGAYCCALTGIGQTGTGLGMGTCQNGQVSTTPCSNNMCSIPGQVCFNNFCCPTASGAGVTPGCPSGGSCTMAIADSESTIVCPDTGLMASTPCANNMCTIPGYQCYMGYCCPIGFGMGMGGMNSMGYAMCPTGSFSTTPCMNNVCTAIPGEGCVRGYCCPITSRGMAIGNGAYGYAERGSCPNGEPPMSSCHNDACVPPALPNVGLLVCMGNICCPA